MAFPTLTGTDTDSGIAHQIAVNQFNLLFGACPVGLVEMPPINTIGNSGYFSSPAWHHEIIPSGGTGIPFSMEGRSTASLRQEWESNVQRLRGGTNSCYACVSFTSGDNFSNSSSSNIQYGGETNVAIKFSFLSKVVAFSGVANTGELYAARAQVGDFNVAADLAGIGSGFCGYDTESYVDKDLSSVGTHTYVFNIDKYEAQNDYIGIGGFGVNATTDEWEVSLDMTRGTYTGVDGAFTNFASNNDGCDDSFLTTTDQGLEDGAKKLVFGWGEYASTKEGNLLAPKTTGSFAVNQYMVPYLAHEASSTCNTVPNSDGANCYYNGLSKTAIHVIKVTDITISCVPCSGASAPASPHPDCAGSVQSVKQLCSGETFAISGLMTASNHLCMASNFYHFYPCDMLTGYNASGTGYCDLIQHFETPNGSESGIKIAVEPANDLWNYWQSSLVPQLPPWGSTAYPPNNNCTPGGSMSYSGVYAGYADVDGQCGLLIARTGVSGSPPDNDPWTLVPSINWPTGSGTTGNLDYGCDVCSLRQTITSPVVQPDICGGTGYLDEIFPGSLGTFFSGGDITKGIDCSPLSGTMWPNDQFQHQNPYQGGRQLVGCPQSGCLPAGLDVYSLTVGAPDKAPPKAIFHAYFFPRTSHDFNVPNWIGRPILASGEARGYNSAPVAQNDAGGHAFKRRILTSPFYLGLLRGHSAISFPTGTLRIHKNISRCLGGSCEQRAHHHCVCSCCECLDHIARVLDASVCNNFNVSICLSTFNNGLQSR